MLAGDRDPLDAHVGAQAEQDQQQPAAQHVLGQVLSGGDRGELGDEAGVELGVLQDVQQVDGAPAPLDLRLDSDQGLRLLLLAARRDPDPRLAVLPDDRDPARGALGQGLLEAVQRRAEPALQSGDELAGILRLPQGRVVDVPVVLEVGGQVFLRVAPPVRAHHPDLPPAQRIPQ
ncbi:hypothetical protein GCM10009646_71930 [Streptomyces aureus]